MNNQYTYNQPPKRLMIPQMGMPMPNEPTRSRGWRERWMRRFGMSVQMTRAMELIIPNWLIGKSIVFFFVAMFACWGGFGYVPDFKLVLIACLSIVLFFYGSQAMAKSMTVVKENQFIRNIFLTGLVIRLLWILYCYFIFNPEFYGTPIGDGADVEWYMPFAKELTTWLKGESEYSLSKLMYSNDSAMDDVGYPMWLGFLYLIFGTDNEVFIPFLFKCLFGAYCSVCIYRVAKRHFGVGTARIAAIFVALNPNMIYWCGTMMKEAEMVFLACLSIDNFDRVLTSGKRYTFRTLLPGMLAAISLMFFRSVLGIAVFLAVFAHVAMASNRVMSLGKKIIAGVLVATTLFVAMGDRIRTQSEMLIEKVQSDEQKGNMEWRASREGGNEFAKYASAAVFAPLIFTVPFPTFNAANEGQLRQIMLSGGAYIKNILSFFVVLVMLMMLISGEWRRHVFILAYTMGYLMVLVMSSFAHSGRFHMPIWPMLMLFAAYGIQIGKTNGRVRRWFPIILVLEVVACLVWNWYKLAGRGLI